ncbi:hypothetical protein OIU77_018336 [Salix suchowensis]|uniref:Uncharacterized protein n=1 Tax=Salix suchowensis TaxID=1278906 RepID=A0ABQ9CFJ4_9ROSI|nr:hypothetical protein OIU77_018336 [Salix suchowensis]
MSCFGVDQADDSPPRKLAEGARQCSRSRPKQREGKQPWIEVSPTRRATKKLTDPVHQVSGPVSQTVPIKQISEGSKQSTVGAEGQKYATSRKVNQICTGALQGQEGTSNKGQAIDAGEVEEEGSSIPHGSQASSDGDEPTATSPAVRKKKSGRKKKGARGL